MLVSLPMQAYHLDGFGDDLASFAQLHPVIDRVFAFERAVEGFTYFAARKHFGKVVITVS